MIELPKFIEEEWFISKMREFFVHGNTAPYNYERAYFNSSKRQDMIDLIDKVIPGYFTTSDEDVIAGLIRCSFEQLLEIKERIDSLGYSFSHKKWHLFNDAYVSFVNKGYNIEFVKKYGIKCCPYCNENYIFSRMTRAGCQLDHFFPQNKYPIFSICLYNLVPVCPVCNHIKSEKPMRISPHDHRDATQRNRNSMHLSYELASFSWPYAEESIDITLQNDDQIDGDYIEQTKNDFQVLQLLESYKYHKDYVLELIRKAILYNGCSIEMIQNSFTGLYSDEEEINRYVFGNYYEQSDLLKRPLSKITRDLLIELDLIEKE